MSTEAQIRINPIYTAQNSQYASRFTLHEIMQNKPNLLNNQMNVSAVKTEYYENIHLHRRAENKPNQTQLFRALSEGAKLIPLTQDKFAIVDADENNRNQPPRGGTSQYKGVSWSKSSKKYVATIRCNKKRFHLGYFKNEIEAAKAYDKKAKELFGEFAYLNFPDERRHSACVFTRLFGAHTLRCRKVSLQAN